jgi:hypothetical protein
MTTGAGPQEKVITPPSATALTTAADVQLDAVPSPTTCVGCEVSTASAAEGIAACPSGFPGAGSAAAAVDRVALGRAGEGLGDGETDAGVEARVAGAVVTTLAECESAAETAGAAAEPHPDSEPAAKARPAMSIDVVARRRGGSTRRW